MKNIIAVNELVEHLKKSGNDKFGLLSHQASPVAEHLVREFPNRINCLFSAEHGWFGLALPGEKTSSSIHPYWNIKVHSLYGETRRPTDEMLDQLKEVVIDLQDIATRCYTYLATLKLMLEECSKRSIRVTVLDRPVPFRGYVDGPMREDEFSSFVAPLNIPLRHGMTPGDCARFIVKDMNLHLDLTIIESPFANRDTTVPWSNFMSPSPGIPNWDSAALYPATVFTEAFRSIDCDRGGAFSFRILGAKWMDANILAKELSSPLHQCGFAPIAYRYKSTFVKEDNVFDGILLTLLHNGKYQPVEVAKIIFKTLIKKYPDEIIRDFRSDWLDKLAGTSSLRKELFY
jgi:uncharacterized protein YbbC (DUF1343 family)